MVDAFRSPLRTPSIYERIGIRPIINGRGATTAVGGSLMAPEVAAAMVDAAGSFVLIEELNAKVGELIAELTGMEAGCVTSGSAAGMALAAAACIAGSNPARIRQLPNSDGMPNEIITHHVHRLNYDQMYRVGGAKIVEIGLPAGTERWELEAAITPRTAAVSWVDSRNTGAGALDFSVVVEIAHAAGLPVIVDAASTLPPACHLTQWGELGAELVIFSGGKGLRGPQDSGLLAGRADLIAAARANGGPHAAVGRGMKVSKEAMAGLWAALKLFKQTDHEAIRAVHLAQAEALVAALAGRADARSEIQADWHDWPAPIVRIFPVERAWSAVTIQAALKTGDPAIHLDRWETALHISTHCLQPGEETIVANRLVTLLRSI